MPRNPEAFGSFNSAEEGPNFYFSGISDTTDEDASDPSSNLAFFREYFAALDDSEKPSPDELDQLAEEFLARFPDDQEVDIPWSDPSEGYLPFRLDETN